MIGTRVRRQRLSVITVPMGFFSNETSVCGKGMGVRNKAMGFSQMDRVLG